MRNNVNTVSLAAGFIFLLIPFVSFVNTNYTDPAFEISDFLSFAVPAIAATATALIAMSALLALLIGWSQRNFDKFLLAGSVSFLALFLFQPIHTFAMNALMKAGATTGAMLAYAVVVALIFVSVFFAAHYKAVRTALLIFAAVTVAIPGSTLVRAILARHSNVGSNLDAAPGIGAADQTLRPNIYYIIVDGYASPDTIKKDFGFDEKDFLNDMEASGFFYADKSHSSYNMTSYTLASIMDESYFVDEKTFPLPDSAYLYPSLLKLKSPPPAVTAAKALGYDFYVVGNYWGPCAGPHVKCLDEKLVKTTIPYSVRIFLQSTPYFVLRAKFLGETRSESQQVDVDALGKVLADLQYNGIPRHPTFMFIHHLSPHPPYMFHADCSLRSSFRFDFDVWSEESRPLYMDNLRCTNAKLRQFAKLIKEEDPKAIVVIQGDHGTAFKVDWNKPFEQWSDAALGERSRMLNLIRVPQPCRDWLSRDINNVNSIRLVIGCAGGTEPALLENRSYIATYYQANPDFGHVFRIKLPPGNGLSASGPD